MRHFNEQIDGMAKMIEEASRLKGIQWNRVTWYSWWLAVFLFCIVIPALSFYIGMEYQKTADIVDRAPRVTAVLP